MRESLKSKYEGLRAGRSAFLERAQECSQLTLSYLYPDEGSEQAELWQSYQSATAQGLQELAAKLTLTLFPVDSTFFRFQLDLPPEEAQATNNQDLQAALADAEQTVTEEINGSGARVALGQAMLYLLCGGSVLLDFEDRPRLHKLDQFTWRRDGAGDYYDICIKEEKDYLTLQQEFIDNPEFLALLDAAFRAETKESERCVEIYTRYFINEEGTWERYQEFEGDSAKSKSRGEYERRIPGSEETYAEAADLPVLPQTFIDVPGEDYGHGYLEVALGDLRTLEGLYKALAEFAAIAANVRWGIRPGGLTRFQDIVESENGGFFAGREEDVFALSTDKAQDMAWVQNSADRIEGRLARFFLRTSSIQRDGERVTAEEVRLMAEDLERALGGAYSLLASRLQVPLVKLFTRRLVSEGKLPPILTDEATRPVVVAGLEALGRSHKLQKLSTALGLIINTLGEQGLSYIRGRAVVSEILTSSGLAGDDLAKSEAEIQAEVEQAQQAQLAAAAAPEAIKAGAASGAQTN
jgi:hypothetical protein